MKIDATTLNATIDGLAREHGLNRSRDYPRLYNMAAQKIAAQLDGAQVANEQQELVRENRRLAKAERKLALKAQLFNERLGHADRASEHAKEAGRLADLTKDPADRLQAAKAHGHAARAYESALGVSSLSNEQVACAYNKAQSARSAQAQAQKAAEALMPSK